MNPPAGIPSICYALFGLEKAGKGVAKTGSIRFLISRLGLDIWTEVGIIELKAERRS